MAGTLTYEDFAVGQTFRAGPYEVTAEAIKAFAQAFDPQPFHLDEAAAAASFFGGLAASGWHTAAITMRLLNDGAMPIAGGVIGSAIDELRWHRPVRPGHALTVETEVLELRLSSKPGRGWMRARCTTRDQDGAPVQSLIANLIVPCRS